MGGLSALPTDSETPRTDLAEENLRAVGGAGYVPASHARELEIELNNAAANYNLCHANLGREVVKCGQLTNDNKNLMREICDLKDALSNLKGWCDLNGLDYSTTNRVAAPCDSCQKPSAWEVVRTGINSCVLNLCDDCYETKRGLMELVAFPDTVKWKRHNVCMSEGADKR
jgi:hypothetical protein